MSGLRQRKKERTRDALGDASVRLFAQKGFRATSVEEIAAAADVSHATFFRYFKAKEEAVFPDIDVRLAILEEVLRESPGPLPERLRDAFLALARYDSRQAQRVLARRRLIEREAALVEAGLRVRAATHTRTVELAEEVLFRGRKRRTRRERLHAHVAAAAALAAADLAWEEWLASDCRSDIVKLVREMFGTLEIVTSGAPAPPSGSRRPARS